jgi:hypothetical protein
MNLLSHSKQTPEFNFMVFLLELLEIVYLICKFSAFMEPKICYRVHGSRHSALLGKPGEFI